MGAVAALSAILGAVVGAGGGETEEQSIADGTRCPPEIAAEPRRLAGQMLVVRMEDTATPELITAARRGEIGGVILFPVESGEPGSLRGELRRLQRAARTGGNPPLLVMTDQEGGGVKRFPLAPPQRSPLQLGNNGSRRDARLEGEATGHFLARLGVQVDLAPVLDVPASGSSAIAMRAFGSDPRGVARLGLAFADGLATEGVIAVPKHFPGLGRAEVSTDVAPVTIDARARQLRADLAPFEEAIADGAEMIMIGLARYPAYRTRRPAALSDEIVTGLLRGQLGFGGVIVTDDLEAPAVTGAGFGEGQAAVAAVEAGVDQLLFALGGGADALTALIQAIRSGRLDPAAVRDACARVVDLKLQVR